MKRLKTVLCSLVACSMTVSLLPPATLAAEPNVSEAKPQIVEESAMPEDVPTSGTCGENLTWTLDNEGTLIISGTGNMTNYGILDFNPPWNEIRNNITKVQIQEGVTSIGREAFRKCSSLTNIIIPDSVTSIGNRAFSGCKELTSITIPDSVTSIGHEAFKSCSGLTSIIIPDSVTSIGSSAFDYCGSLLSIIIPYGVINIGESMFSNCKSLKSITIPDSVTSIDRWAFKDCSSLTNIIIPDSVTDISYEVFSGCSSLKSITIPDGVTSINSFMFDSCSSLKNATIPKSVTSIGRYAFNGCISLPGITIPNSVTSIGEHAFSGCSGLKSITIPKSVTSIDSYAFNNCKELMDVYYPGSKEEWKAIKNGAYSISDYVTIHYNSTGSGSTDTPDDSQKELAILYFGCWDANTKRIYSRKPTGAYEKEYYAYFITDQTVVSGADSVEQLLGQYVLLEYVKKQADGSGIVIGPSGAKVTNIQPLETYTGVVSSIHHNGDQYTFTIDGVSYIMTLETGLQESKYEGKKVFYQLYNGQLVQVDALEYKTGILKAWDSAARVATIDDTEYNVHNCVLSSVPSVGSVIGFCTTETISTNTQPTPVNGVIVQMEKRNYETKTGTVNRYSSGTVVINGQSIPVNEEECEQDVSAYVNESVFYLLANGKLVHLDNLEKADFNLKIRPVGLGTAYLTYQNGRFDKTEGQIKLSFSNEISYSFPRFYNMSVIENVAQKNAVTLKGFQLEDGSKISLRDDDGELWWILPEESKIKTFTYQIQNTYVPVQRNETIIGNMTVSYLSGGEKESTRWQFNAHVTNKDYKPGRPGRPSGDTQALTLAQKAATELEKCHSALALDMNQMKMNFGIEGAELTQLQDELLTLVVLSNAPKATFQGKLTDKMLKKVFGKYKPGVTADKYTVSAEYEIETPENGRVTVRFDCKVFEAGMNDKNPLKYVQVNYTIKDIEKGSPYYGMSGFLGGGASADVSAFASAAYEFVESELKSAYDKAWGNNANEVADWLFGDTVKKILKARKTSFKDVCWKLMTWPTKQMIIGCPVDIYVYDQSGQLCGAIENNKVTKSSEDFELSVDGDTKYVSDLDDRYMLKYVATGDGLMNINITEYGGFGMPSRQLHIDNVPLQQNRSYTQEISEEARQPEKEYQLLSDQNKLVPVDKVELLELDFSQEEESGSVTIAEWKVQGQSTQVKLNDPDGVLQATANVFAAVYDENGRMLAIVSGTLDKKTMTVTFPGKVEGGWKLFFLNDKFVPLCDKITL